MNNGQQNNQKEMIFVNGASYYSAAQSAPAHIIGDLDIWDLENFVKELRDNSYQDDQGRARVRIAFKRPKADPMNGKPFVHVSDYRPQPKPQEQQPQQGYQQQPQQQQYQQAPPQQQYQQAPPQQNQPQQAPASPDWLQQAQNDNPSW